MGRLRDAATAVNFVRLTPMMRNEDAKCFVETFVPKLLTLVGMIGLVLVLVFTVTVRMPSFPAASDEGQLSTHCGHLQTM